MTSTVIENNKIVTLEQNLQNKENLLSERKEIILMNPIDINEDTEISTISENNKFVTLEHTLSVQGNFLSEKKDMILVEPIDSTEDTNRLTLIHLRQINDKFYKVTEDFLNGHEVERGQGPIQNGRIVDTTMSDEEIQQFEEDWKNLWKPQIAKNKVYNILKGIES